METNNVKSEKICVLAYELVEEAACSLDGIEYPSAKMFNFILSGSRDMGPDEVESVLDEANDFLIEIGISAEQSTALLSSKYCKKTGYAYAFVQTVMLTKNTISELKSIDTGEISSEEAIAIWLLVKYGDKLQNYDSFAAEYAKSCAKLAAFLEEKAL
ncbi:MAG: hypothetical protein EOM59_00235 [Clostridia bacterium]|nr:hypothetical protein [Clostridia bacterium]